MVFDRLEKAMIHAWDGSNLSAFFIANRKTCLDWLSRIRIMAAHLAFHAGEFAFCLRQCFKALEKGSGIQQEQQEDILALAAFSMKSLDDTGQSISGLYAWAEENLGKKFRWMKGLVAMAKGRTEDGLALIKTHLGSSNGLCHQLLTKEILRGMTFEIERPQFLIIFFFCKGHFSLCEFGSYSKWMEEYKEQTQVSSSDGFYAKSLEALCTFGTLNTREEVPGFDVSLSLPDGPRNIEQIILSIQDRQLRTKGTNSFHSFCASSFHPFLLGLVDSDDLDTLKGLLEDPILTKSQWKRSLILNNVNFLLGWPQSDSLETFLKYRDRTHCTESLLLIKKWGEHFLRNYKLQVKPHLHFALSSLNLEIAIQARKEFNYQLASRHLEQSFGNHNIMSYISGMNFNDTRLYLSTDQASGLRQCAKLSYVLQPSESKVIFNTG